MSTDSGQQWQVFHCIREQSITLSTSIYLLSVNLVTTRNPERTEAHLELISHEAGKLPRYHKTTTNTQSHWMQSCSWHTLPHRTTATFQPLPHQPNTHLWSLQQNQGSSRRQIQQLWKHLLSKPVFWQPAEKLFSTWHQPQEFCKNHMPGMYCLSSPCASAQSKAVNWSHTINTTKGMWATLHILHMPSEWRETGADRTEKLGRGLRSPWQMVLQVHILHLKSRALSCIKHRKLLTAKLFNEKWKG